MAEFDLEFHSSKGRTVRMDELGAILLTDGDFLTVTASDQSLSLRGSFDPARVKKRITHLLKGSGITFTVSKEER